MVKRTMREKTTDDLNSDLLSKADFDQYLQENEPFLTRRSIPELLHELYQKGMGSKAALARKVGMSEVYLHQIFSGRRNPSRDRLLALCIGMEASLEEIQNLLKQTNYAPLYPRMKRDAIIMYGIVHHLSPSDINDKLFAENEKTLF